MDTRIAATAAPLGILPDVRTRLRGLEADLSRLQAETAWECAAARQYRASLDELAGEVARLHQEIAFAEADLRAAWRAAVSLGGC